MKQVSVVVGANYGDEGKGSVVNQLCENSPNSLVVRYCGGSQAGHTVEHQGIRHVFKHIGSGTLAGAATYLTQGFIVNPYNFWIEYQKLRAHGITPAIFVNKHARVTTIYDMVLNIIREKSRGDKRHGSCGTGIFETICRSKKISLTVGELQQLMDTHGSARLMNKLNEIREYCISECKVAGIADTELEMLYSRVTDFPFVCDCVRFFRSITVCDTEIYDDYDRIIFEGSQGLLLDERFGVAPHLTPTEVGAVPAVEEIANYDACINLIYCTRPYLTRHGAGPFPTECVKEDLGITEIDRTNVFNQHQGEIRYGYLDTRELIDRITCDATTAMCGVNIACIELAVSCVDQLNDGLMMMSSGAKEFSAFAQDIVNESDIDRVFETNESVRSKVIKKVVDEELLVP